MEEYTQITLDQWMQWKEDIRRKLKDMTEDFIFMGYRLRQISDSGMFDGAKDIYEFANREYGLSKSTTSRFIAINKKYSIGGYSGDIKEEFKGFDKSKLQEMLTLPDTECELITAKTTVKEIRELRDFVKQPADEECGQGERTPLENCIIDFFSGKKDVLNEVMGCLRAEEPGYREAEERINPGGQGSHRKGIVFLFMYDWVTGIKYKLLMQPEPVSMTWPEFLNEIYKVYAGYNTEDTWADFYNKKEEKTECIEPNAEYAEAESECGIEEPVATSQQDNGKDAVEENERGGTTLRGSSGQADMEAQAEKTTEAGITSTGSREAAKEAEEDVSSEKETEPDGKDEKMDGDDSTGNLEGQMDITQYEGIVPGQQAGNSEIEDSYMDALREILDNIFEQAEQRQYSYAEELLEAARGTINKIREIMRTAQESESGGMT